MQYNAKKTTGMNVLASLVMVIALLFTSSAMVMSNDAELLNETNETTSSALPGLALSGMTFRMRQQKAELTRAGLVEVAKGLGVKVNSKMSKQDIRDAITAAQQNADIEVASNHTGTGQVEVIAYMDDVELPTQRCGEVLGKIKRLNLPGDGPSLIETADGKVHSVHINTWTALGQAMERGLDGFYYKTWTPGGGSKADSESQRNMINLANKVPVEERATCKFRVIDTNQDGTTMPQHYLYAVLSDDYTEVVAEDLYNELRTYLDPSLYHYKVRGNDGIHAGHITVTQRNSDSLGIFNYYATIDCGKMNGMASLKVSGGARILACANQLSFDVAQLARELNIKIDVGTGTRGSRRHAGDIDGITDWVCEVMMGASDMEKFAHAAFSTDIDKENFDDILDYWSAKRGMSAKLKKTITETWADDELTQVPETLYGLVMALTYVGTHDEEQKSGISYKLRTMGGELLAIAPHWNDLFPAIQGVATKYREEQAKKLAEAEAARQKQAEADAAVLEAAAQAAPQQD